MKTSTKQGLDILAGLLFAPFAIAYGFTAGFVGWLRIKAAKARQV
jgi:hypothetical protein